MKRIKMFHFDLPFVVTIISTMSFLELHCVTTGRKVFKMTLVNWKGTRRTAIKHLLINNYRFINELAMVLFWRALWCQVIFHSASPVWEEITTQIFIFLKCFRTSNLPFLCCIISVLLDLLTLISDFCEDVEKWIPSNFTFFEKFLGVGFWCLLYRLNTTRKNCTFF